MDETLQKIVERVEAEASQGQGHKNRHKRFQQCHQLLRKHVDNGWLFINYRRRGVQNPHSKGQPVGCAVAFFVKGQLYVGASACMLPPAQPARAVQREAYKAASAVLTSFGVSATNFELACALAHYYHTDMRGCDKWSRHLGIWKAVRNARLLDIELAAQVNKYVDRLYKERLEEVGPGRINIANLMATAARSAELPEDFSFAHGDWDEAGWLHDTREVNGDFRRYVPYRVCGTVVHVVCNAIHVREKHAVVEPAKV